MQFFKTDVHFFVPSHTTHPPKMRMRSFFRIFPQFFMADALFYAVDVQFNIQLVYFYCSGNY